MIKGIIALFKSGLIFNPMVFSGILLGFVCMGALSDEQLHLLYTNSALYVLLFLYAGAYTWFFRRVYRQGGLEVDLNQTIMATVGNFLRLVISFIFSMLFVMVISFGGTESEPEPQLPEFDQLQQDLMRQQKELQKNYEAIMEAIDGPTR